MEKNCYERRVYESVDAKILFWDISRNLKNRWKTEFTQQKVINFELNSYIQNLQISPAIMKDSKLQSFCYQIPMRSDAQHT